MPKKKKTRSSSVTFKVYEGEASTLEKNAKAQGFTYGGGSRSRGNISAYVRMKLGLDEALNK